MNADEYVVHSSIGMTRGSLLRIEEGRDLVLYVWEGGLWLTQEGDLRDRYLGAGDCFRLDRSGVAVASASRRSSITLTAPEPAFYARRVVLTKAGSGVPVELYDARGATAPLGARLRRLWAGMFAPQARPTTAAL